MTRQLGRSGPVVSALGLGAMAMSGMYGAADRGESIATIHAALDAGVTLIDTGDFYGMGHNELLIAEALRGRPRDEVVLSVKFGAQRGPDGAWLGFDARPAAVKTALAHTLTRLDTDHVDIYRPARLDPAVPIEETVGAIAQLVQAGYVRHIGLSEVGADTVRRAAAVAPIADLQIEYSLISRGPEARILPALRELGIGLTAYGVLSRGLLSGHWSAGRALGPVTSGRTSRGSRATTWTATWRWWRCCAGWPSGAVRPWRSWPSRGWRGRGTTSCRWWGPAPGSAWPSRWARGTSPWSPRSWGRSPPRCPRPPGIATRRPRCATSTASGSYACTGTDTSCLSSAATAVSDCLASPNSMLVLGFTNSGLSTPA